MEEHHQQILSWFGNLASASAVLAAFAGLLPPIGALIAIIWYGIQISESRVVQDWVRGRRSRKIAKLKAHLLELEARTLLERERVED